jgi:hypothetical protein
MKSPKVNRKFLYKLPTVSQYTVLIHQLMACYKSMQELLPNKLEISLELVNGSCFIFQSEVPVAGFDGGHQIEGFAENCAEELRMLVLETMKAEEPKYRS